MFSFDRVSQWHCCMVVAALACLASDAAAHSLSMDVLVDEDNQLYLGPVFEVGPLTTLDSISWTTSSPGISVASPGNGLPDGATLGLDVVQGLLHWDGDSVTLTDASLTIESPSVDGFSQFNISPVGSYFVRADSGYQTRMLWGTYQNEGGTRPGWHSDGNFSLASPVGSLDAGLYGAVLQITSPGYTSTEPFLVPFEHDPQDLWDTNQIDAGIGALEGAMLSTVPGDLDGDRDVDFDDIPGFVLGLSGPQQYLNELDVGMDILLSRGDIDGDHDLDFDDIPGFVNLLTATSLQLEDLALSASIVGFPETVPEPSTLTLLMVFLLVTPSSRRVFRADLS